MKIFIMVLMSVSFLFGAVDVNTASKKELMSVKGIGSKKAEAIIDYRKMHCFNTVAQLTAVKGIGPKFMKMHQNDLTASACKK